MIIKHVVIQVRKWLRRRYKAKSENKRNKCQNETNNDEDEGEKITTEKVEAKETTENYFISLSLSPIGTIYIVCVIHILFSSHHWNMVKCHVWKIY